MDEQPGQRPAEPRVRLASVPVVLTVVVVLIGALVAWWLVRSPNAPTTTPSPSPSITESVSPSATPAAGAPKIPHEKSTRTPPPVATRTQPRTGLAPQVSLGEPVEFVDGTSVGLLTVLAAEWLEPREYRKPAEGYEFLAIQVQFEAIQGSIRYSPVRSYLTDADAGRYSFVLASQYEDHPQFEIEDLAQGETVTGWVLFEAPRTDLTFVYQNHTEQAIRVPIPGGPVVEPAAPPIELAGTFTDDSFVGQGRIAIEGAAWFTDTGRQLLAVRVRISGGQSNYQYALTQFSLKTSASAEQKPIVASGSQYRPPLTADTVVAGDAVAGWIFFEAAPQESTLQITDTHGRELGTVAIAG